MPNMQVDQIQHACKPPLNEINSYTSEKYSENHFSNVKNPIDMSIHIVDSSFISWNFVFYILNHEHSHSFLIFDYNV